MKTLPGSEEKRYREEIDKSYGRITFYLCSTDDYLDNLLCEDEDEEGLEDPVFVTEIQNTPSHDNENSPSLATEVQVTSSEPQEVESGSERLTSCPVQKEVDRPTRLLQFVAFVDLPFSFRSLDLFCSFTLV